MKYAYCDAWYKCNYNKCRNNIRDIKYEYEDDDSIVSSSYTAMKCATNENRGYFGKRTISYITKFEALMRITLDKKKMGRLDEDTNYRI